MTWFSRLMGFEEENRSKVHSLIQEDGAALVSRANGCRVEAGRLEIPSLSELRDPALLARHPGALTVQEVVSDVQALHGDPQNENALFQVASQFNLLEMVGPDVSPERGIGGYEFDRTQGPACAIACGAGTIYRNYFVPLGDQRGQTHDRQVDTLSDVSRALAADGDVYWEMRNGYALPKDQGLQRLRHRLKTMDDVSCDALMAKLRVGVQWQTEVTLQGYAGTGQRVSQVYGSALPVAYAGHPASDWDPFAPMVLRASYESTLWVALRNLELTGSGRVFLTLLGGGAFGNPMSWIETAILQALESFKQTPLQVNLVSYGRSNPSARSIVARYLAK